MALDSNSPLTDLLNQSEAGHLDAANQVYQQLCRDLRAMSAAQLAKEREDHSWGPTDLVQECYLRIFGAQPRFANRFHFFRAASTTMQRLLVEHARRRGAQKRIEGNVPRTPLEECYLQVTQNGVDLVDLHDALSQLEALSERQAEVIRQRHFAGLTWNEIAAIVECSESQVRKDAANGEAFLRRILDGEPKVDA